MRSKKPRRRAIAATALPTPPAPITRIRIARHSTGRAIVTRPMATASAPPAAAPSVHASRPAALRVLPAVATVVGVAALLELVYDRFLNYDARYALVWARDLARGLKPDYEADFAPTPHPLETVVSILATPFETGADTLLVWLMLLCFGGVVWLTYRLGEELFNRWVGVVAALVVLTRPVLERDALLGYQDAAFALLIVAAVLLEARRRRRGVPVLGAARAGGADPARGVGARRALLALAVAGARQPPAGALRRPRLPRARCSGRRSTGT